MAVSGTSSRTYDGLPVEDRRADRRTRFLTAGLAVFGESGYQNSSITMLCRAAGLARSQFYEHFTNREDLLLAVYDEIQEVARREVAAAIAATGGQPGLAPTRAAVTAFAESVGRDPHRAQVTFVEVVGVSAAVEAHRIEQREKWVDFFAEEMRKTFGPSFIPPGGYRAAATGFIGALMALVHQWSTSVPRPELTDAVAVLTCFLNSLAGPR
ncbi:TetR/AcrR family transcriptional regulator [Nocardia sp. NPDC058058]|uniref:TetR/AcrR family transcriptional regulator n=1 Tax=Nocardia sp. NPDC058058 TaxID=3346317 RepID=UPI0036DD4250